MRHGAMVISIVALLVPMTGDTVKAQISLDSQRMINNTTLTTLLGMESIEMEGIGVGKTKSIARKASELKARRRFVEFTGGVRIDSETTVVNAEVVKDEIVSQAQGAVKYAKMIDASYKRMDDGKWEATVRMMIPLEKLIISKSAKEYLSQEASENPLKSFNTAMDGLESQKLQTETEQLKRRNKELEVEIERLKKTIGQGFSALDDEKKLKKLQAERKELQKRLEARDEQSIRDVVVESSPTQKPIWLDQTIEQEGKFIFATGHSQPRTTIQEAKDDALARATEEIVRYSGVTVDAFSRSIEMSLQIQAIILYLSSPDRMGFRSEQV